MRNTIKNKSRKQKEKQTEANVICNARLDRSAICSSKKNLSSRQTQMITNCREGELIKLPICGLFDTIILIAILAIVFSALVCLFSCVMFTPAMWTVQTWSHKIQFHLWENGKKIEMPLERILSIRWMLPSKICHLPLLPTKPRCICRAKVGSRTVTPDCFCQYNCTCFFGSG